jgi:hypothetical protein
MDDAFIAVLESADSPCIQQEVRTDGSAFETPRTSETARDFEARQVSWRQNKLFDGTVEPCTFAQWYVQRCQC